MVGGSGFQLVGVANEAVEPEDTVEQEGDRRGRPVDDESETWRYRVCSTGCIVVMVMMRYQINEIYK